MAEKKFLSLWPQPQDFSSFEFGQFVFLVETKFGLFSDYRDLKKAKLESRISASVTLPEIDFSDISKLRHSLDDNDDDDDVSFSTHSLRNVLSNFMQLRAVMATFMHQYAAKESYNVLNENCIIPARGKWRRRRVRVLTHKVVVPGLIPGTTKVYLHHCFISLDIGLLSIISFLCTNCRINTNPYFLLLLFL